MRLVTGNYNLDYDFFDGIGPDDTYDKQMIVDEKSIMLYIVDTKGQFVDLHFLFDVFVLSNNQAARIGQAWKIIGCAMEMDSFYAMI